MDKLFAHKVANNANVLSYARISDCLVKSFLLKYQYRKAYSERLINLPKFP